MSLYRFGEVIEKTVFLFIDVTFLQGKKIGKKKLIFYSFIVSQSRSDTPSMEIYTKYRTSIWLFLFYYYRNFLPLDKELHLNDFTECQELLG